MLHDIRYTIRQLLKNPGFTVIVILTLALSIGANAALFSVVNGVLLKPLPLPDAHQLVTIYRSMPNFETGAMPYPNFLDLQKENKTFQSMAISRSGAFSLIGLGETERVSARIVSANYFSVLGVKPRLGRTFIASDDSSSAAPVVLISADLWAEKFGSAPDVLERSITLDDKGYRVVGVIPATFTLTRNVDVFVPIAQWNAPGLKVRSAGLGLSGIGRLKPGVTVQQAEADLDRLMQALAVAYPDTNKGHGAKVMLLIDRLVGDVRTTLWVLLAAVGFVLLISCVNVSSLLLARSTSRTREYAIRAALGAGRWRLVRQSLLESMVLAVAGGTLGLMMALWGTKLALAALPTALPRADEVGLDGRVLVFTIVLSVVTGLLAGIVPSLKTSHKKFSERLNEGGRGASAARARAHGIFVAAEMAMALVLLVGAGLMIRSLNALWNVDPGFQAQNVVTFELTLPAWMRNQSPAFVRATLLELNEKINRTPGILATSFSSDALPMVTENDLFFFIEGQPKPANTSEMSMSLVYTVEPDYLKVMRIPLKEGRFFTEQDNERSQLVGVIDETFARKHFPDRSPLGRRIHISLQGDDPPIEIVGVVGHVKHWGLDSDDAQSLQAQLYLPFRAATDDNLPARGFGVVVRTSGDNHEATQLFASIRNAIQSQNNQNVISNVQTLNQVISDSLSARRFSMILLAAFAGVALLLASLGIYGVVSYLVAQRTKEMGIRLALGAGRRDILHLVLRHGMKMTLAGVAIGLIAAFGLTRLMTSMLFGVGPTDPITFGVIALFLVGVALLACFLPARRATKVDPLIALRYE